MQVLIFKDNKISLSDKPKCVPLQNEALIEVRYAGICNTDIELLQGYMDFEGVPGHEFVGVVRECQDDSLLNKLVTGEINIGCGYCEYCSNGMQRHCPTREVLGILKKPGVFSEYVTLPYENLFAIPDEVSELDAVFIEPLSAALSIFEQVNIEHNSDILLVGDGKLALLIAFVLSAYKYRFTIVGKHLSKLRILDGVDCNRVLLSDIDNKKYDYVIEASGSISGFETAINRIKPRSPIILKSTYHKKLELDTAKLIVDEITLTGSRCGRFTDGIKFIQNYKLPLYRMISKIFPFDEALKGFKFAQKSESIKVILDFTG